MKYIGWCDYNTCVDFSTWLLWEWKSPFSHGVRICGFEWINDKRVH